MGFSDFRQVHNIYALIDPRDEQIFYIGNTTNAIDLRLSSHLSEARNYQKYMGSKKEFKNIPKCQKIHSILETGLLPKTSIVDQLKSECRLDYYLSIELEQKHIRHYISLGYNLLNARVTDVNWAINDYAKNKNVYSKMLYYYTQTESGNGPTYAWGRMFKDGVAKTAEFQDKAEPEEVMPKGLTYVQMLVWKNRKKFRLAY